MLPQHRKCMRAASSFERPAHCWAWRSVIPQWEISSRHWNPLPPPVQLQAGSWRDGCLKNMNSSFAGGISLSLSNFSPRQLSGSENVKNAFWVNTNEGWIHSSFPSGFSFTSNSRKCQKCKTDKKYVNMVSRHPGCHREWFCCWSPCEQSQAVKWPGIEFFLWQIIFLTLNDFYYFSFELQVPKSSQVCSVFRTLSPVSYSATNTVDTQLQDSILWFVVGCICVA